MIERGATYSVDTWDPVDDTVGSDCGWNERAVGLGAREMIRTVREYFSWGYSEASILVSREYRTAQETARTVPDPHVTDPVHYQ